MVADSTQWDSFSCALAFCTLFCLFFISTFMIITLDPITIVVKEAGKYLAHLGWIPSFFLILIRMYLLIICSFGIFRLLFLVLVLYITGGGMIETTLELMNSRFRAANVKWKSLNFKWSIRCYNTLIICMNMSQFVELVSIVLMATGMAILVTFNFIILRLYNFFPFLIWCYFPFIDIVTVGAIQLIVPRAVTIAENSNTFVHYMRLH